MVVGVMSRHAEFAWRHQFSEEAAASNYALQQRARLIRENLNQYKLNKRTRHWWGRLASIFN
jgi:hypothetical protein